MVCGNSLPSHVKPLQSAVGKDWSRRTESLAIRSVRLPTNLFDRGPLWRAKRVSRQANVPPEAAAADRSAPLLANPRSMVRGKRAVAIPIGPECVKTRRLDLGQSRKQTWALIYRSKSTAVVLPPQMSTAMRSPDEGL